MRMYEDDKQEAASIIAWTERRLERAGSSDMVRAYWKIFKSMWIESFGNLDNVPEEFKIKVKGIHDELKKKEGMINKS